MQLFSEMMTRDVTALMTLGLEAGSLCTGAGGTGSTLGVISQALSALFIQLELSVTWDSQRRPTGSPRDPPVFIPSAVTTRKHHHSRAFSVALGV